MGSAEQLPPPPTWAPVGRPSSIAGDGGSGSKGSHTLGSFSHSKPFSTSQVELQPSPLLRLPSSQISPSAASVWPSPQYAVAPGTSEHTSLSRLVALGQSVARGDNSRCCLRRGGCGVRRRRRPARLCSRRWSPRSWKPTSLAPIYRPMCWRDTVTEADERCVAERVHHRMVRPSLRRGRSSPGRVAAPRSRALECTTPRKVRSRRRPPSG